MKRWRYWNANGFAVAVVAVVTMAEPKGGEGPDEPFDWGSYIGATEGSAMRERETVAWVADWGCKLSKNIACAFFPQFAEIPYRY